MSHVNYSTACKRIDLIKLLHCCARLGEFDSEPYHLALLNVAAGEPFKKAIVKAEREISLRFINKAFAKQARELYRLRRSRRTEAGAA